MQKKDLSFKQTKIVTYINWMILFSSNWISMWVNSMNISRIKSWCFGIPINKISTIFLSMFFEILFKIRGNWVAFCLCPCRPTDIKKNIFLLTNYPGPSFGFIRILKFNPLRQNIDNSYIGLSLLSYFFVVMLFGCLTSAIMWECLTLSWWVRCDFWENSFPHTLQA